MEIEVSRPTNLTLTQSQSVSDSPAWVYVGSPSSGSIMRWMYNSDLSDTDNFEGESETSYLVIAISCHSCLDIGAIQVLRNAIFLEIGPPPTPS